MKQVRGDMQELCLGGTLTELMISGGLATTQGGIHVHRLLTILQHVASGLVHLHRLSLTYGDLDPSQVPAVSFLVDVHYISCRVIASSLGC